MCRIKRPEAGEELREQLEKLCAGMMKYAVRHSGKVPAEEEYSPAGGVTRMELGGAELEAEALYSRTASGGVRIDFKYTAVSGSVDFASVGVALDFGRWSRDDWVFMPACVYGGNRFPVRDRKKRFDDSPAPDPENWITITSAPHLEYGEGRSRIQVLAGDCSTPCAGVLFPEYAAGLLVMSEQRSEAGETGLCVEENDQRTRARILVKCPGVREGGKYNWQGDLPDRGARLECGDTVSFPVAVHVFEAHTPEDLYARFAQARKELGRRREKEILPFSYAFELVEDKHNRENWVEEYGYWSVGMRECPSQDWQTGWVGGPNTAWPMLTRGGAASRARALRVWDFIAEKAVTPSGFVRGCFSSAAGAWQGDGKRCYMRYSADTLYFLMKTLLYLKTAAPHREPSPSWIRLARGLCGAFVKCWKEAGHLPHYADSETGGVVLGGSCAAALAPAGLALAARYFGEEEYMRTACAAARRYRDNFLSRGVTNGGPGDIFQNVDSESSAALLESFVVLMEETGGSQEWTDAAARAAAYFCTWVTSYDFRFPPESTFGRMDMLSCGTVWANVQNKHAAPGICSLSGSSLFKLWRAAGDRKWLELIRDIAHSLPQFVSRRDRPICDTRRGKRWPVMPPGWVNERVNLSDWEVRGLPFEEIKVGEIFGGSTWAESALLNTVSEVPGIYLDTETLEVTVFDHVFAQVTGVSGGGVTLRVTNPTAFDAEPVVLAESPERRRSVFLGVSPLEGAPTVRVPALSSVDYAVPLDVFELMPRRSAE